MRPFNIFAIVLSVLISLPFCCYNIDKNDKSNTIDTASDFRYETYYNARWGFSIDYPSFMTLDPAPTNGDGQIFRHGDAEMRVYGGFDMTEDNISPKEIVKRDFEGHKTKTDTYTLRKNNYYVLSGIGEDGKIYYMKRVLHTKAATVWYTYLITYPVEEKEFYDPIIKHCLKSFDITSGGIYESEGK